MTNLVILTRDRPRLLKQTLDTLFSSVPRPCRGSTHPFTLTVIDDGTTDNVAQQLLTGLPRSYCHLEVRRSSNHNLGDLKTLGVEVSRSRFGMGDWLCLADNDVGYKPGWLERMEEMATESEKHGFRLWGGQNHPFHGLWTPSEGWPWIMEASQLAGTHMFMRWSTWDACGPLKSAGPGPCMGEDVSFCERVHQIGRIGVASPFCVVDCGLTRTDGAPAPGLEKKVAAMEEGWVYE